MEWLDHVRSSIDYLEEHLDGQIETEEAARKALMSKFHYQRMFHMITGLTLADYVRKRRLTIAAQELSSSSVKVLDVALKYGYQTPEAFTKAFQRLHGMAPSEARKQGAKLKAFPRLSFQIQIKGVEEMDYHIEEKEGFTIVGVMKQVSTRDGENFKAIPAFWQKLTQNGMCDRLAQNAGPMGLLGVSMDYSEELEEMNYLVAVEKTAQEISDGEWSEELVQREIPTASWAVFECVGAMPDAMQEMFTRIFTEWFPATGYSHAGGPELEVYLPGNPTSSQYRSQIRIPVLKKEGKL
jgi:AraC family transcriptional regulator